ncbi:AN1-type zinc finger protein [Delitschia confertaspora ATCC 74209]|uniref:AN1-type zinc finger protein n=1 Tax=Delitschia confertaspora ATCC 74209 TaxID=1513339 RepID=A0A9P4JD96_9PLEO|nr:AN1-type zinc finger protein [Delitschia confertaspora ATCC 74209]
MMLRTASISSVPSGTSNVAENIQIFIKGIDGKTFVLDVPTDTPVSTLRALIALRLNVPSIDHLRIVFAGKQLDSLNRTIADYSVVKESTLHLYIPLRGGMPPKKIRCSFKECKDAAQRIVGDCGFCSGHFCGKHRLLEDHKCEGLEDCKKESHERNADKLNSERTVAIKGV